MKLLHLFIRGQIPKKKDVSEFMSTSEMSGMLLLQ